MAKPVENKDRQSMLCIGGPLDGERFVADTRDGFVVPVIDRLSHPLPKLDSPDVFADSVSTVINTHYRAEPFHTPHRPKKTGVLVQAAAALYYFFRKFNVRSDGNDQPPTIVIRARDRAQKHEIECAIKAEMEQWQVVGRPQMLGSIDDVRIHGIHFKLSIADERR